MICDFLNEMLRWKLFHDGHVHHIYFFFFSILPIYGLTLNDNFVSTTIFVSPPSKTVRTPFTIINSAQLEVSLTPQLKRSLSERVSQHTIS